MGETVTCYSAVAVVDIKGMYTGKDCPHIKDRGKKVSILFIPLLLCNLSLVALLL